MLKRFALLTLISLLLTINGYAQHTVSGKVSFGLAERRSQISVSITDASNRLVYAPVDSSGNYSFNGLKEGKCSLMFSGLNFETTRKDFYLNRDTLIDVILKEKILLLAEIDIHSEQMLIERKTDRTVFNVEKSVLTTGADVMELLEKLPGVRVLNDRVSLAGKGSVNIMVNDKLIPLSEDELSNYLKSMSAGEIAKVEVITNPPARYDAQGNYGLINILLKKPAADGVNASVNTVFTQATYPTASVGATLSYRRGKITINTNFNFRKGSVVPLELSRIFYPKQTWEILNKDRNYRTVPTGQVSADYQLSKKTLIGVSYSGGLTNFHSEENIKTTVFDLGGGIDSILNSDAHAQIRSGYRAGNLYLKQLLSQSGKVLNLNADWFDYGDDRERYFDNISSLNNGLVIPDSFAAFLSTSKQDVSLYTLKADLDFPLKIFKLSMGSKLSIIKNLNDVAFYQRLDDGYRVDLNQSNVFKYEENTQAVYFNLSRTAGKWDFQGGLRGEYTQINADILNQVNHSVYLKLFPTFYVVYRSNVKESWSFNYGRRINRPPYKKLNPFRWYSNQYVYTEGNPFLQPSYNDNIEMSYAYGNTLVTTVSLSKTTNGFADVNFVDSSSDVQISKPSNFLSNYSYQLSQTFTLKPLKTWQSINQLNVFYNVSRSNIVEAMYNLHGIGGYFSTANQLVLNSSKTFLGDVNFWYQLPTVEGLNKNKIQYNLDLGVKALFSDKRLQISLTANDILKTNRYRFNSEVNRIRQEYNNYYDARSLRISLRFNFGNEKVKQPERKTGNEEERRRN